MKKYIVLIVIMVLSVWGCASPEGNGTVELDGPILESFDRGGNLEFNGAVINMGDEPVSSVYVVIVLKDQSGNIIEANSVSVYEDDPAALLYPAERAFFSLSVASDPSRVFSREVEIYYEDGTDVAPSS